MAMATETAGGNRQRIALVTGAARRIGRAIALDLARHGWAVALHYHQSGADAAAVLREIEAMGGRAVGLEADLSDARAVAALVPRCITAIGVPDCLVNNASLFLEDEIHTLTSEQWDRQLAVNLEAPVFLAKAFAAALPTPQQGSIINIIDERVWRPTPLYFSYAVSKAGLWAATRTLAQALAPRIRVNAIGPGPVLPSSDQTQDEFEAQCAATPLRRPTTPDEIAAAVRFIIDAPAMTGQMIALDGGQHLAWETPDVIAGRTARKAQHTGTQPVGTVAPVGMTPAATTAYHGVRRVIVRDLEIKTIIGVHEYEKRAPQRILVNVQLMVRETGPAVSDRLEEVVDYGEVVRNIEMICKSGHVNLVETLAEKVAQWCLSDARVQSARVRIEKPDVISHAGAVGIEIERQRAPS